MKKYWCSKCEKYHFDNSKIGIEHIDFNSGIRSDTKRWRW